MFPTIPKPVSTDIWLDIVCLVALSYNIYYYFTYRNQKKTQSNTLKTSRIIFILTTLIAITTFIAILIKGYQSYLGSKNVLAFCCAAVLEIMIVVIVSYGLSSVGDPYPMAAPLIAYGIIAILVCSYLNINKQQKQQFIIHPQIVKIDRQLTSAKSNLENKTQDYQYIQYQLKFKHEFKTAKQLLKQETVLKNQLQQSKQQLKNLETKKENLKSQSNEIPL